MPASYRRAGLGNASRMHQVQSRGTHRARPGAHSELRRHGRSRPRAEEGLRLRHGRPSPPQKGGGVKSNSEKKKPTTFFKEKAKPK